MSGKTPIIFITGNSRSGTTMLGRILGNHSSVYTFHELQLLDSAITADQFMSRVPANTDNRKRLLETLFTRQRAGLYADVNQFEGHSEVQELVEETNNMTLSETYECFLRYEADSNGRTVACEQSPYYLSYVKELGEYISDAVFVNIVRDPRDVALSQKNRWKRNSLGQGNHPFFKEVLRSWANYHPFMTAKIWANNARVSRSLTSCDKVLQIKYENLLSQSDTVLAQVCEHIGIDFEPQMTDVPEVGSSSKPDSVSSRGLNPNRIGTWKTSKDIGKTEIGIIQNIARDEMEELDYELADVPKNFLAIVYYSITFVVKMSLSVLLNAYRYKNIVSLVKRRLNLG